MEYSASPRKHLWGQSTKFEALEKNVVITKKLFSFIGLETGNSDFYKHLIQPLQPIQMTCW